MAAVASAMIITALAPPAVTDPVGLVLSQVRRALPQQPQALAAPVSQETVMAR
jgi:hypothetical protein